MFCTDCGEDCEVIQGLEDGVVVTVSKCCHAIVADEPATDGGYPSDSEWDEYQEFMEGEELIDGVGFADPGGRSSLRAVTEDNPRDQPCPTCGRENALTRIDKQRGYQCNRCADAAEGFGIGKG